MVTVETITKCGYSVREARDILTRTGDPENLHGGKRVVRIFKGLRDEGGEIVAAGERDYAKLRRKNR